MEPNSVEYCILAILATVAAMGGLLYYGHTLQRIIERLEYEVKPEKLLRRCKAIPERAAESNELMRNATELNHLKNVSFRRTISGMEFDTPNSKKKFVIYDVPMLDLSNKERVVYGYIYDPKNRPSRYGYLTRDLAEIMNREMIETIKELKDEKE